MSLFTFENYRAYLRAYIRQLPNKGRGELTRIAQHLRVNTTLLSQVLSGGRDFSQEQAFALSEYLGHSEVEKDYFALLIQAERAGTKALRQHLEKKLRALRQEASKLAVRIEYQRKLTDSERSIFYSSWIYSAVHLFTSTAEKGVTLEEIAARFGQPRARAAEITSFLTQAGLCAETLGRYSMGTQSTFVEQGSPHLLRHHANWRVKAIQKSESISENEMMYTGQVSLSAKDFEVVREQLAELLKDVMRRVKESPAENVACLNLDWFWVEK
ncbi:MAG TPA: TIGR02147 family protein [Bdellovibrionales bacterium]|nr:TIGR02147 family protein [Bdellovibrionales bacterium]